jgi:hypothetical protein
MEHPFPRDGPVPVGKMAVVKTTIRVLNMNHPERVRFADS